jgi:hypothetical protein
VLSSDVTLLSFDQTLALMGGYAGTVWLVIGFFIAGFQDFAYYASMIRRLYTKDRMRRGENLIKLKDKNEIEARVLNRIPGTFNYLEFWTAKWTMLLCCCFKSAPCYQKRAKDRELHAAAFGRIEQEIDILNFI